MKYSYRYAKISGMKVDSCQNPDSDLHYYIAGSPWNWIPGPLGGGLRCLPQQSNRWIGDL